MNDNNSIPIIDISPLVQLGADSGDGDPSISSSSPRLRDVVEQISRACKNFGFFAVTNHGVNPTIITSAWDASTNFFDLDPAIKQSVPMSSDYPYGYESHESLGTLLNENRSSAHLADSKETFSVGPIDSARSGMPSRQFPENAPATFAPALTQYFDACEKLARILFRGLALALQLDADWFLRPGCFDDGHQCALRVLNYPQLEHEEDEKGSNKKVHIRAGAHTDYGAMTILKSGGPGLQLQLGDNSSSWIDVPYLSDAFIINLGDLMQRWTNDRWRSTLHRVIAVADKNESDENNGSGSGRFQSARRQSIAFFVNMNGSARIVPFDSCVDEEHPSQYNAVKASEHLILRHSQSMGNTG